MIQTTLKIEGMMCGMCEAHINDAIRNSFNVKKVSSSHTKGETVIVSEDRLDSNSLIKVIEESGYKLISLEENPYERKSNVHLFGRKA